ncbi:MAG: NHL repeat-containing protein [Longimicrobiales bacterium]
MTAGNPEQEFDRVVTPFLLSDGRLAVPLAGFGEIRIFDPQGRLLSTLGGAGEGPGEFRSLQAAWARGDTIEAFDDELQRVTRFWPGGEAEVIRIAPIPSAQAAVPGSPSYGWVLMGVADAGMGRRDQVALHRFGRDGSYLGEVGRFEGMARFRTPVISGPDPLSPKTVFVVAGDSIYAGESLTPSMQVIGPDGAVERQLRWVPAADVSPGTAYQAVIEAAVAQAAPDEAQRTRLRLESFPKTNQVSVFWGVQVDADGFLWIRPYDPLQHSLELGGYNGIGVGGTWLVLTRDGRSISSVTVPSQLEPASITSNDMIGIRKDELGVESVCVHRVNRHGQ